MIASDFLNVLDEVFLIHIWDLKKELLANVTWDVSYENI